MKNKLTLLALAALSLTGCEGLVTGSEVARLPLEQSADGNFASVKLQLTPEMNPIAINIHGETIQSVTEGGRWNTYSATLTFNGGPVGSAQFHVNNTGGVESPQGGPFQKTMMYVAVAQAGEHELTIRLVGTKEITVESPQVVVRRNTQPVAVK